MTVVLSLVNVGVFVWFTRTLIALTPIPDTPSRASAFESAAKAE